MAIDLETGSDDVSGADQESSGTSDDGDGETDVEIGVDVMFDEDEDASDDNQSGDVKDSNHQISLNNYATSNPILLALFVLLTTMIAPLGRLK